MDQGGIRGGGLNLRNWRKNRAERGMDLDNYSPIHRIGHGNRRRTERISGERRGLEDELLLTGFAHIEFLHSVSEGISTDIQKLGCFGLIAIGHLQGLPDQGLFYFFH